MIGPVFGGMSGTSLTFDSAAGFMDADDARVALANRVTGKETPAQLALIAAYDKALALKSAQDKTNYEVGLAMQDAAIRHQKKEMEHRAQRIQNGYLF